MPAALVLLKAPALEAVARQVAARHDKKGARGMRRLPCMQRAARHSLAQQRQQLPVLLSRVPSARLALERRPPLPARLATAGKGKLGAAEAEAAFELPCLEVLLGLPARGIARRSEGHLNQSLEVGGGGGEGGAGEGLGQGSGRGGGWEEDVWGWPELHGGHAPARH